MTTVSIVLSKNGLALVQWSDDGTLRRAWVTEAMLQNVTGHVAEVARPERGMPYGDDLTILANFQATPEALAEVLKARGIWTYQDVLNDTQAIVAALQALYGVDAGAIMTAAQKLQ